MSATAPDPDLVEPSPAFDYILLAMNPSGGTDQQIEMSLEEYDALKAHLVKLRGLAPDEDAETSRPSPTPITTAPPAPELEGKTATARMMVDAFNSCISRIRMARDVALEYQQKLPDVIKDRLLSALVLDQLLMDWEGGDYAAKFPDETEVIAAIRGNLEL